MYQLKRRESEEDFWSFTSMCVGREREQLGWVLRTSRGARDARASWRSPGFLLSMRSTPPLSNLSQVVSLVIFRKWLILFWARAWASPATEHLFNWTSSFSFSFERFDLFQWPTCKPFGLLSPPDLAWSLHPTPPLSLWQSLLAHTLLITTLMTFVLSATQLQTSPFHIHLMWHVCKEEAFSHFLFWCPYFPL